MERVDADRFGFSFFLFITGVSLVYSFSSRLARGQSRAN